MNRRMLWRSIGAACAGWMLAGCAMLAPPQPPRVNVVGIDALPGEGMELRMALTLRLQNPNDVPLDFDGISLELDVRGSSFASGVSAVSGSVPRFGESLVTVPVSVSALTAVRQAIGLANSLAKAPRPMVDYALRGRLSGTGFGGLRFESKGEIELPGALDQRF
jgi:LEA14-like dessication related protein